MAIDLNWYAHLEQIETTEEVANLSIQIVENYDAIEKIENY